MTANCCTEVVDHSKVKIEENGRKVVFRNDQRKKYRISQIDGCIVNEGVRADYLVSRIDDVSILVELKGSDVAHACKQLLETVKHPKVSPLIVGSLGFVVVCSKYPRFDTFVMKAKTQCARQFKAGFHVLCQQRELDIEKVAQLDGL